jgi:hypothetical protein
MQFLPYLAGPVQRHLKKSIFNLNKPKDVEALVYVVQKVFNAVQLVSANEEAHTECTSNDLLEFGSKDVDGEDNGLPQAKKQKRKRDKPIDRNMVKKMKKCSEELFGHDMCEQTRVAQAAKRTVGNVLFVGKDFASFCCRTTRLRA